MAETVILVCFFTILILASIQDIKKREITDMFWLIIMVMSVLSVWLHQGIPVKERVIGAACAALPFLLLTLILPGAFGGGDIKLLFSCGLFLGARIVMVSSVIAILTAGGYVMLRFIVQSDKKREAFPLVPFLSVGMLVGYLFYQQIIDWYLKGLL